MGMITDETREQIRARTDLVALVSAYVSLKKSGRRYVGLCPFHRERTPSFTVDRERGLFYCFGCGAGGDVFDFVMRMENVSFLEAVRLLGRAAGIEIEEATGPSGGLEPLYRALEGASRFYEACLRDPQTGVAARAYLKERAVDPSMAEQFRLGYAPDAWDALTRYLVERGHTQEVLEQVGLVHPRPQGGYYDVFRHRLIFPILDLRARVIGFGGRALRDQDQPKYLNSRESPLFHKGRTLYGLGLAREGILKAGYAILVEGYLDVIACHQHGIRHAVASLGTALTSDQVQLLRRFTGSAVLVYDSDEAGQRAAERALPLFEELGVEVRAVTLPEGLDPDAFLRQHGRDAFLRAVEGARSVFEFRLEHLLRTYNPQTVGGKLRIVDELSPLIASYRHELSRDEYLRLLTKRLGIPEDVVRRRAGRRRITRSNPAFDPDRVAVERASARGVAERHILMLMLDDEAARIRLREALCEEDFGDPVHRTIFRALAQDPLDLHGVRRTLGEAERAALDRLVFAPRPAVRDLEGCLARLRAEQRKERRAALVREVEEAQRAGDLIRVRQIQEELQRLV
jgi:DNA primase